ncbi:unnamed protein product [Adineta ricciae]|uniref:Uncharacterized protein n=1 Tax=Adineta ricciae TaxID=249248 RepID=A0A815MYD6_ADIRI|nr:unnamed protein product [Adineta ricciae]CAF1431467.1 unnamed protein product [Adineta ricciae]
MKLLYLLDSRKQSCFVCIRYCCFILTICLLVSYYIFVYRTPPCAFTCPYKRSLTSKKLIFDQSHYVKHFSEFVCPQNFRNLADWVFGWPDWAFAEQTQSVINGRYLAPCLPSGSILYVKADFLNQFFGGIYPYLRNQFVLITSQGDLSVPQEHLAYLHDKKSKIIHWFGQNANIQPSQSLRFTPIPIGINCFEMANSLQEVYRQIPNNTVPAIYGDADEPHNYTYLVDLTQRLSNGYSPEKLLLINFEPTTDPTGLRRQIWKSYCSQQSMSNMTSITCVEKPRPSEHISLSQIYIRNRQYPMWLSPRGNGLDCHRTWEAFYLDAIPIVWNSTLNPLFHMLPAVIINDMSELTEEFLRTKLKEIVRNKIERPNMYQFAKLRFSYWRRLILSTSRYAISETKRDNICWRARTLNKNH